MNHANNNKLRIFSHQSISALFIVVAIILLTFLSQPSLAANTVKDNARSCEISGDGKAEPEGLKQWRFFTDKNTDLEFEQKNGHCAAFMTSLYLTVKETLNIMRLACKVNEQFVLSPINHLAPTIIMDSLDYLQSLPKASGNTACQAALIAPAVEIAIFTGVMNIIYAISDDVSASTQLCGAGWKSWNSNTKVKNGKNNEGGEWIKGRLNTHTAYNVKKWVKDNSKDNKNTLQYMAYREYFYGGVEYESNGNNACPDVTISIEEANLRYGEGLYTKVISRENPYPSQRYYYQGTQTANFDCEKYNFRRKPNVTSPTEKALYKEAYDCCIKNSQTTICIEQPETNLADLIYGLEQAGIYILSGVTAGGLGGVTAGGLGAVGVAIADAAEGDGMDGFGIPTTRSSNHKLCTAGEKCLINSVEFKTEYKYDDRMICAESYNLCPYNFNVGFGTDKCDIYQDGIGGVPISKENLKLGKENKNCNNFSEIRNEDCTYNHLAGKCKNYCQILNHCTVVNSSAHNFETRLRTPYISSACIDFAGDSKNSVGYDLGISTGNYSHFSAPIAQCIKETLENVFYNKAGHSSCGENGLPNSRDECFRDIYDYQKGVVIPERLNYRNFFSEIQSRVQLTIQIAMSLAVVFLGMKLLLAGGIKRQELMMFVIKIGLVSYFATGSAWQATFFDGLYSSSETLSQIVMKIKVDPNPNKQDGCQFGALSSQSGVSSFNGRAPYPKGKEYLAIFDTLDCKISHYLGFGKKVAEQNIASIIIAGLFSGGWGVFFATFTLIFGFLMIIATFRTLHIFITSAISIIMMVYVSPIIIPTTLFERTKNIFKNWLSNLIGFCLQPVILFAYIGMFITIFDQTMIGSATFEGDPPAKTMICDKYCDNDGVRSDTHEASSDTVPTEDADIVIYGTKCDEGYNLVNPQSDSVACIIGSDSNFNTLPGLEGYGIRVPVLVGIFSSSGREKILTLAKAALILYILTAFIDQIPGISSGLAGGAQLPTQSMSIKKMLGGTFKVLNGVQERARQGIGKHAPRARDALKQRAKETTRHLQSRRRGGGGSKSDSSSSSGSKGDTSSPVS